MDKSNKTYVTKRLVNQSANRAFKNAAKKAIKINGYNVIYKDNWIVKEYSDGTIEKLKKVHNINTSF